MEDRRIAGMMPFISFLVRPSLSILLASSSLPPASLKSLSFMTTWVRAISAIMAGRRSMPYFRVAVPKEYLVTPVTASIPTQAMKRPIIPEMILLGSEFPETPAISEIPRIPIEKYSTDVKFDTSLVINEAHTRSRIADSRPPHTEAKRDVSSAFLTFPFLARG